MRWGEATGLRVWHVDRQRRRVLIEENAVIVNGSFVVGTTKNHERRTVPYPPFLDEAMAKASAGKDVLDLLWPAAEGGGYLRPGNSQTGWFAGAVARARAKDQEDAAAAKAKGEPESPVMPRVSPHDLRHTSASLAISAGANAKAVQRMLGHASAAMTLDVYTDLFDDDLDAVAEAMDRQRATHLA